MLVKCKNCGYKNQHTSIFCKGCATKLDKEQFDKAIELQKKKNTRHNKIRTVRGIVGFVILLALLYAITLALYPSFFPTKTRVSRTQISKAAKKLNSLQLGLESDYNFSPSEATILYNKYFLSRYLKNSPLTITISSDNFVVFLIKDKIINTLPIQLNYSITGTPLFTSSEQGKILSRFMVKRIKLGNLPIPSILGNSLLQQFKPYYTSRTKTILKKISAIDVDKDAGFTIHLKNKEQN